MKTALIIISYLCTQLSCNAQELPLDEIIYLGIDLTDKEHFEVFRSSFSTDIDVLGKDIMERADKARRYQAELQVFLISDKGQANLVSLTHKEITSRETERQRRQIIAGFLIRVKRDIESMLHTLEVEDLPATRIYEPLSHITQNHPAGVPGVVIIWSDLLENHKALSLYTKENMIDIAREESKIKKDCYCDIGSLEGYKFYLVSYRICDNDRYVTRSLYWWCKLVESKGGFATAGSSLQSIFKT